ncbi:MAG: enoyl-CoA hydratase [Spirochaetota bacterium]|nr:enoyl-CoA hydratase [Spirochaetota bacterium]
MKEQVLFEVNSRIATITLNRPERRNAINQELLKNLYNYIDEVSSNKDIGVAIITGRGKSFCSGIDLDCIETDNLFNPRNDGIELPMVFGSCHKPIIGAINGHAITGGLEIALNCDFLIASEDAYFADTHSRVGIQPGWGMSQLLQRAVGIRMAKQMSLSCNFINADEALRCGLVNEIVPQERLMQRVQEIAADIISANQDMIVIMKDLIDRGNRVTLAEGLALERNSFLEKVRQFNQDG